MLEGIFWSLPSCSKPLTWKVGLLCTLLTWKKKGNVATVQLSVHVWSNTCKLHSYVQCNLIYFWDSSLVDMALCCLASSSQDLMKWRRYHNLAKHREPLSQQHYVISHMTSAFRNTVMRTSKPTDVYCHSLLLSVMFCSIWVIKYIFRPWSSFPDTRHWKIADRLLIFELHMCSRLLQCTLFQGNSVFVNCFSE